MRIKFWKKRKGFFGRLGESLGRGFLTGIEICVGVGVVIGALYGLGKIIK